LTICDQPISVDLEGMEDDPNGIISLLELSTCERDKWIVAAAHYRRNGNPVAAIKVLTSMMKGDHPPISCFRVVVFQELIYLSTQIQYLGNLVSPMKI
jgi:hypothetical protein